MTSRGGAILNNSVAERRLIHDGFVVVDLLDDDGLNALRSAWRRVSDEHEPIWDPTGMAASVRHPGVDAFADRLIRAVIEPALGSQTSDLVPFMSSFLVKRGGSAELPAHLDWRLLDEQVEFTHGCWVALEDVGTHNGALGVLPGSHLLVDFDRTPEDPGHDWVQQHLATDPLSTVLELHAGQAVIYDHRLVHFSPPNNGPTTRVASNSGLCVPARAEQARHRLLDMMARGMAGSGGGPQIPAGIDG